MGGNLVETLIGAVVLVVAAVFLIFAYNKAGVAKVDGYELVARFDKVDGIRVGSDVVMSGIKIGTVVDQQLDRKEFIAVLRITVDELLQLPTDSTIKVTSSGLLGDKYLAIEPGASDEIMEPGDTFEFAQGSIDLMDLLGKAVYATGKGQ
ncbi:MAG: outer membrane lipid asymmetry maintenance protein MlaD [Alphaproteobacteria bacterium]|jgi:phospholipid/cholesterol/gamma-HCH transport system substrate-binding protein|nr:outer membrane lipid asymmetry maintenance protein MlaD [Alphaproteobacteria bacterium]